MGKKNRNVQKPSCREDRTPFLFFFLGGGAFVQPKSYLFFWVFFILGQIDKWE